MRFLWLFFIVSLCAYERTSSYPYLSGDTWRFFCDWQVAEGKRFDPKKVKRGDAIFVEWVKMERFAKKYLPQIREKFILVTPNCEFGTDTAQPGGYRYLLESKKIAAWFVQNIDSPPTQHLIPIPIGLTNTVNAHGQIGVLDPWVQRAAERPLALRHRWIYLNFAIGTNRQARLACVEHFANIRNEWPRSFEDYLSDLSDSVFVISPPGNGMDCHRTWEALLMGCYPIVLHSMLDPLYENLPVVVVHNWDAVTEELLHQKYEEFQASIWRREKLYAEYWFQKVRLLQQHLRHY